MRSYSIPILGVLFFFLTSCESDKSSLLDYGVALPYLKSADLATSFVHLDTTGTQHLVRLTDGRFEILDSVSVVLKEAISGDSRVRYRIFRPNSNRWFLNGSLAPINGIPTSNAFSGTFTFVIERADIGNYRVELFVEESSGSGSNSLFLPLTITRNNSIPALNSISAPDTVVRPTTGPTLLLFTATASDSDGYGDINEVYFRRISPSLTSNISLYDDGMQQLSGDQVTGDGIFSRIVRIDSTAILGQQVFEFFAKDNFGEVSSPLLDTIMIVP